MHVTKQQIKQLIKEELENVLNEGRDPAKLKAAAAYMKSHETISMYLSQAQGGGRPPELQINGIYVGAWLATKTGYSLEEIMKVANQI
jgi:hypothetical protein